MLEAWLKYVQRREECVSGCHGLHLVVESAMPRSQFLHYASRAIPHGAQPQDKQGHALEDSICPRQKPPPPMNGSLAPGRILHHPIRSHDTDTLGRLSLPYRGHATKRHSKPTRPRPTAGRTGTPSRRCRANVLPVSAKALGVHRPWSGRTKHGPIVRPRHSSGLNKPSIVSSYQPFSCREQYTPTAAE